MTGSPLRNFGGVYLHTETQNCLGRSDKRGGESCGGVSLKIIRLQSQVRFSPNYGAAGGLIRLVRHEIIT